MLRNKTITRLDVTDIPGTNGYLDDEAKNTIRSMIGGNAEGIHFIGSGNYHHLSLMYLETITEDFSLVLFDNHPDMQQAAFGGITSCGGWAREAAETLPHLKDVYMIGMEQELIDEVSPLPEQVGLVAAHDAEGRLLRHYTDLYELVSKSGLPVYVSFDEDVLSTDVLSCGWSQGIMKMEDAKYIMYMLYEKYDVIGIDLCGENEDILSEII